MELVDQAFGQRPKAGCQDGAPGRDPGNLGVGPGAAQGAHEGDFVETVADDLLIAEHGNSIGNGSGRFHRGIGVVRTLT
jgi:hypothetical protein